MASKPNKRSLSDFFKLSKSQTRNTIGGIQINRVVEIEQP